MAAYSQKTADAIAKSGIPMSADYVTDEVQTATACRCDEPDADPYSCEADNCSGYFSELNPFGGSRPAAEPELKVSRKCSHCDYRTTVWHVDDGSAEAELHEHTVRVHVGRAEAAS